MPKNKIIIALTNNNEITITITYFEQKVLLLGWTDCSAQKVFKEYLLNGNVCEFLVVVGWLKFFIAIIEVILGADTKFNLIHQKECITMNDALRKQATRAPLTFVFLQLFFVLAKFIFSRKIVLL